MGISEDKSQVMGFSEVSKGMTFIKRCHFEGILESGSTSAASRYDLNRLQLEQAAWHKAAL